MASKWSNSGLRGTAGMKTSAETLHPTTAYLMILVILEYIAYAVLRYVFRTAHGG